jgi:hypothetical protein
MAATAFTKTDWLSVAAYAGDAKTLLAWDLPEERSKDLAGFTIECHAPQQAAFFLSNRLRFEHPDQHAQDGSASANSSVNAPFHKFRWLHVPGGTAQGVAAIMGSYTYVVTPRYFDANGALQALDPSLSASVDVEVGPFDKGTLQLGFTRGYVQSQAYVEHFGPKPPSPPRGGDVVWDTSQVAGTNKRGESFTYADEYEWLGFMARKTIFSVLNEVIADPSLRLDMFAYDLNEPDVLAILLELAKQGRVRLILDDAPLHHDATHPKPEDKFEALFTQAANAPAQIQRGHFSRYAHDKVLIVSNAKGPTKVLTGSTNFSVTGLYVNSNHVLVFNDPDTAAEYGKLFQEVWDDHVETPAYLASPYSTVRFSPAQAATPPRTITFAPHDEATAGEILNAIATRVGQEETKGEAIGSVLFAVMQLDGGTSPIYTALNNLHANQTIFSYGISDNPDGIALYAPGKKTGVLVTGKPTKTRLPPPFDQVPSIGLGHQIHHKFVICDFNGDNPVVFCGSSNLASGGEQANGDNLIEIHDPDVAAAFAIEALALVDHFQFLDGVSAAAGSPQPPPTSKTAAAESAGWFLSTTDGWVKPYFDPNDLHFIDRQLFAGPPAG